MKTILAITSLVLMSMSPALASEVGILGGFNSFNPSVTNTSTTPKLGHTFGFMFQFVPGPIDLELDVLYASKKVEAGGATFTLNSIQFPLMVRLAPLPIISVGFGGYYQMGVGNVTTERNGVSASTDYNTTIFYTTLGLKRNDYGAIGSVRLKLPLGGANLIADLRYLYGLQDNLLPASSSASVKYRSLDALVGVSWGTGT